MTQPMTSHERFTRLFAHQEPDRIPIIDVPWDATIQRWHREGMPAYVNFVDFFDLDRVANISVDNSPRYPVEVLEETETTRTYTSSWGVTMRQWKSAASTPEFLDFTIRDPDSWQRAKAHMQPTRDRINWDYLKQHYPVWRREGYWIQGNFWFGFDVTHSWMVGTERVLFALVEEPDWCQDMFQHQLEVNLALLDQVWDAGYHFDMVSWPDDMGYKHNQFFSLAMYREPWRREQSAKRNLIHKKNCFCSMRYALCAMLYALCSMRYALCALRSALQTPPTHPAP